MCWKGVFGVKIRYSSDIREREIKRIIMLHCSKHTGCVSRIERSPNQISICIISRGPRAVTSNLDEICAYVRACVAVAEPTIHIETRRPYSAIVPHYHAVIVDQLQPKIDQPLINMLGRLINFLQKWTNC